MEVKLTIFRANEQEDPQDTLDLKSSMCRKVPKTAKNIRKFDITGKDLFESIGSLNAPAPLNPSHSRVPK